ANSIESEEESLDEVAVRDLTIYERGGNRYIAAATDDGIFVAENSDVSSTDIIWKRVSQALTTQTTTAIAVSDTSKHLFAGSIFEGFVEGDPEAEAPEDSAADPPETPAVPSSLEWPNFRIQDPRQIDLETLYPQILTNSWVVLYDDRDPQNPAQEALPRLAVRQAETVFAIQQAGYGLSNKVTRIALDDPLEPEAFGLRSTTVFVRSEALALALEPLTVGDRGFDIFQDPVKPDTVFLPGIIQTLQPQQTLILRGQHCRLRLDHIGGVYRARSGWEAQQGLENLSIRHLGQVGNVFLAGTDSGLYWRSPETSSSPPRWQRLYRLVGEPVYTVLDFSRSEGTTGETTIWAGTEQGLYQARAVDIDLDPDPDATVLAAAPWQRISALPEEMVLALARVDLPQSGESRTVLATVSGTTLLLSDVSGLRVGDIVALERIASEPSNSEDVGLEDDQRRFVTSIEADTVTINAAFDPEPETGEGTEAHFSVGGEALFVGMRQGLYRSPDYGKTWDTVAGFEQTRITAIAVWNWIVFVGTPTGLWRSQNAGQSWVQIEPLQIADVRSLLVVGDALWVGTRFGLYRITDVENMGPSTVWIKGLRDRTVLSLTSRDNRLIVGTDRGIYGSRSPEDSWTILDAGLPASEGRSLQSLNGAVWVGTEAGAFRTQAPGERLDPTDWERQDTGLINSQVTVLGIDSSGTVAMAGTTEGVFRSGDGGRTWEPQHIGLTPPGGTLPLRVQALLAQSRDQSPDRWFAGTPEGIFQFDADQQQWQTLSQGLVYGDVRAIAVHRNQIYIGTAAGGVLRLESASPDAGATVVGSWRPTGLGSTTVQALASVRPSATGNQSVLLAGTDRDGLFLSCDGGTIWKQVRETRPGRGTLSSSGNQVTWRGGAFNSQLQPGDSFNAAGQTRTVINIDETSGDRVDITINTPFRPELPQNTSFTINTGLTNRNITAVAAISSQEPDENGDEQAILILFAATAGSGVYRSKTTAPVNLNTLGDRWEQVIANLDDLEIRSMAAAATGGIERVWVGTGQGVFRSDDGGDLWASVDRNLTNTDVQAIALPPSDIADNPTVLVGGIGILTSPDGFYHQPTQRGDMVRVVTPPLQSVPADSAAPLAVPDAGLEAANAAPALWTIQVRDQTGFKGVLKTPDLSEVTLLPADEEDAPTSEVVAIKQPPIDQRLPLLTLQQPLTYAYDPATVQILANIIPATHGETAEEVLGSGDGTEANPHFQLKKPPLTYVVADTPQGAASTLDLRVNGILWQEVSSLYPLQPQDQSYIIQLQADGTPVITFGDGIRGARVPSGENNVTAVYRSGLGPEGNVGAERLTILNTRPQGITDVTNPLAATGGAGPEAMAAARTNAPATVRTLDRIVSLQDFEDFAQGFAGIGKAEAIALWNGSTPLVHITVAGAAGAGVPETSSLYEKLVAAIDGARDPIQIVEVMSYEPILFNIEGRVLLDPRYLEAVVMAQIDVALVTTFAFEERAFGQSVTSAEVIEAIQAVEGVQAVDLDALYRLGRSKALRPALAATPARYDAQTQTLLPAQLLRLNPAGVRIAAVPTL
ncbi:MAG: putative baseplate assembly protein, partial [Elainellaceae cyanobacterium]